MKLNTFACYGYWGKRYWTGRPELQMDLSYTYEMLICESSVVHLLGFITAWDLYRGEIILQPRPALWFWGFSCLLGLFSLSYFFFLGYSFPQRIKSLKSNISSIHFLFWKFLKSHWALIYSLKTYYIIAMVLGGKNTHTTITWPLISRTHSLVWQRWRGKSNTVNHKSTEAGITHSGGAREDSAERMTLEQRLKDGGWRGTCL